MAEKKFFLNRDAKKTRKKTLDELEKKDVRIDNEDQLTGGFVEVPRWLEVPSGHDPGQEPNPDKDF